MALERMTMDELRLRRTYASRKNKNEADAEMCRNLNRVLIIERATMLRAFELLNTGDADKARETLQAELKKIYGDNLDRFIDASTRPQ